MEAMAQVACALTGRTDSSPVLEDMRVPAADRRPAGRTTTIRLAALVRDGETVDVVIRSGETEFRRRPLPGPCSGSAGPELPTRRTSSENIGLPAVPIDPAGELYGPVLFQGEPVPAAASPTGRPAPGTRWRSCPRVPRHAVVRAVPAQDLLLADPGTRDAVMHAIQCCVPDATLLPAAIEKLHLAGAPTQDAEFVVLDAVERSQDGDSYVYDVDVLDPSGRLVERWEGLTAAGGPQARRPGTVAARAARPVRRTARWSGVLGGTGRGRRRATEAADGDAGRARTALAVGTGTGQRRRPCGTGRTAGRRRTASRCPRRTAPG